jgi:DNA-binding MurR/RpiR family transcriptional regulator
MPPLVKIRSERDGMSAIERRVADFILENAHLMRDYSSQQLASALGISQSSVVKFSQKFGFRGYPDLKYSIGEAIARAGKDHPPAQPAPDQHDDAYSKLDRLLRESKAAAEEETRLLNPREQIQAVVGMLDQAPKIFVCGLGDDGLYAREFAMRLSLLGVLSLHHTDPILLLSNLSAARNNDLLLIFSEFGQLPVLCHIAGEFKARGGSVVTITRHTANPLRAIADQALVISAHDRAAHICQLLYRSSLQSLLDLLFVLLCQCNPERGRALANNMEQLQRLLDA